MNLVQGIKKMMGGSAVGLSYGTAAIASNFAGCCNGVRGCRWGFTHFVEAKQSHLCSYVVRTQSSTTVLGGYFWYAWI